MIKPTNFQAVKIFAALRESCTMKRLPRYACAECFMVQLSLTQQKFYCKHRNKDKKNRFPVGSLFS